MTSRKWLVSAAAAAFVSAAAWVGLRAEQPLRKDIGNEPLMRQKLLRAQAVLEGVTTADYALIEANANELIAISKKAEWGVFKTPEYERQSDEFRRSVSALIKAAKEKNIDASTLAYLQTTMNCVNCHKHIRDARLSLAR